MIGIGVIGCGHWGPNHVRVFGQMPDSRVRAVADPDTAKLERLRHPYPGVRLGTDHREILEAADVDAVVIATPIRSHHALVREALEAGKHVLCEKPLCRTAFEARELVDLARARGRVLAVGHVFLFNAGLRRVKALIDDGELGTIHYLAATRTNLGIFQTDAHVAYDLAAHDIAVFNWLLDGQPESVMAIGAACVHPSVEDVAFVSLRYPRGIVASIRASWLDPKKVREITVVGSNQMVTWDDLNVTSPVAIYERGATLGQDYGDYGEFLRVAMWDGDIRLPKVAQAEPLKTQAAAFLAAVGGREAYLADGAFGAGVVAALEAIDRSLRDGGRPVRLDEIAMARP